MKAIARTLAIRALTLFGVLVAVLLLLVVSLGLTGVSDKLLEANVNEELRAFRIAQSQTIRDPDQLEKAVAERKTELEAFYGL
ncbi:MAG: peptide ABC transporter permease, partial [Chloroflexota bacterium]